MWTPWPAAVPGSLARVGAVLILPRSPWAASRMQQEGGRVGPCTLLHVSTGVLLFSGGAHRDVLHQGSWCPARILTLELTCTLQEVPIVVALPTAATWRLLLDFMEGNCRAQARLGPV